MSDNSITKFLWKEQRLVYLKPANNDLELLDVLVMIKKEGVPLINRHPVLQRFCSIFGREAGKSTTRYRDAQPHFEEEEEEEEEAEEEEEESIPLSALQEELQSLRKCVGIKPFKGDYLQTQFHGDWTFKSTSSAIIGLSAAIGTGAAVGARAAAGDGAIISDVESEKVNIDALRSCLSSTTNPWAPNIDNINKWCAPRGGRDQLELWVVTKLFYHRGIVSKNTTNRGMELKLPMASPVGMRAEMMSSGETEIAMPADARIAFAFQAIRVRYDLQEARLIGASLDMGKARPAMRASPEEDIIIEDPQFNMDSLLDQEAWESVPIDLQPPPC